MKKDLLIITKAQFGYHTDTLKYCQYLKDEFNITFICFDIYENKIIENGIKVLYVPNEGSYIKRGINFIGFCRKHIKINKPNLIFVVYFKMAFILGFLFRSENIVLDIRTGAVWYDKNQRIIDNFIIKVESTFFKHITVISQCLQERLKLNKNKVHILPLGSDPFVLSTKKYDNLHLLYVGGLNNRNIFETIYGLKIFLDKCQIDVDIKYDIVGFGYQHEENMIKKAIEETSLSDTITFHGKVAYDELKPFFDKNNVGICYVPVTEYFHCQPSTKLYEYINSGLVCIATNTFSNEELITKENGILCNDNPISFSNSLEAVLKNKSLYTSESIRNTLIDSSWKNIVNKNLKSYIKKIIDAKN